MSFDWSQFLNVARELAGTANTPANQEAKLRAAISLSKRETICAIKRDT